MHDFCRNSAKTAKKNALGPIYKHFISTK